MNGCLIDPKLLDKGSQVFHITKGWISVQYLTANCIRCLDPRTNEEYEFNYDGKARSSDVYPFIYSQDPFLFVLNEIKKAKKEVSDIQFDLTFCNNEIDRLHRIIAILEND